MSGDIVALAMSEDEALERIGRVKSWMGKAPVDDLIELYQRRAWVSLGLESWDALCDEHFGGVRISLPVDERRSVVGRMTAAGMSTRAIASATGVSNATISRDQSGVTDVTPEVRGTDGKTYQRRTEEAAALAEFVDADPDVRSARIRARFSKWLWQIHQWHLFDPDEVAGIAADRQQDLNRAIQQLEEFSAAFDRAVPRHLRVVDGGRS